jgi:hypothetical protein
MLRMTVDRLTTLPMQNHLKRHLLCVFLCAMTYNPLYVIEYFEKLGQLNQLFSQIFELSTSF